MYNRKVFYTHFLFRLLHLHKAGKYISRNNQVIYATIFAVEKQ